MIDISQLLSPEGRRELLALLNPSDYAQRKSAQHTEEVHAMLEKARETAEFVRQLKTRFYLPNRLVLRIAGISQKTLWKIQKSSFDPLSVLTASQSKKLQLRPNFEANEMFLDFFNQQKDLVGSVQELLERFRRSFPTYPKLSLTSFRRRFLVPNGIKFKVRRHLNSKVNDKVVQFNRGLFLSVFRELALDGSRFVFFDESIFQVRQNNQRGFEVKNRRPMFLSQSQPIVIKLNLICSFEEVLCFQIDDGSTTSQTVFNFIHEFVMREHYRNATDAKETVIVLDNSPKNKSQNLKSLAANNFVRLFYTVPNSPLLNFVENIFWQLKKRTYSRPVGQR